MKENIEIKLIIGKTTYSYIYDCSECKKELIQYTNYHHDINEKTAEKIINRYFKDIYLHINISDLDKYNGNHFIYGFIEGLCQTSKCPSELYNYKEEIIIETKKERKHINAATIGKLIEAHYNNDEEKFLSYANFIAESYEKFGDIRASRIINNKINKIKSDNIVILDKIL